MIYIIPKQKEKFIKVITEPPEYPCPLTYQLGLKHSCKKVVLDIEDFDMVLSCNDFACNECIFKINEIDND